MKWWLQTRVFRFIVVLFNTGEIKTLVASAGVERYLLTDWEHDTVWESQPLRLAPSVLLTGSLQWNSLLCVCLLSHCSGRQTRRSPEAASACLALCGLWTLHSTCEWGLSSNCVLISPSLRKIYLQWDMLWSLLEAAPWRVLPRWQCFIFCCVGQVFISRIKCVSMQLITLWRLPSFDLLCPQRDPLRSHRKDATVAISLAAR